MLPPIIPLQLQDDTTQQLPNHTCYHFPRRTRRNSTILILLGIFLSITFFFRNESRIIQRDIGYLLRPIWDRPPKSWNKISRFAPSGDLKDISTRRRWCQMHGWTHRPLQNGSTSTGSPSVPKVYDAIMMSSELDMLEIRLRELEPYVDVFIIVEATRTLSGIRKPTYFAENKDRFSFINDKIVHYIINDLVPDTPKGDFSNEQKTREFIGKVFKEDIKPAIGSLIIQSDVDEIISRDTIQLLKTCQGYPHSFHLHVRNYFYSFEFSPLDDGYWRPKVITTTSETPLSYNHGRQGDVLLMQSGWHCSWCFRTLEEFRLKMLGYSHNDRMTNRKMLKSVVIQNKVCEGENIFGMWPEAFNFRDLIIQSGAIPSSESYVDVPFAVREDPEKFRFLLKGGCVREEGDRWGEGYVVDDV